MRDPEEEQTLIARARSGDARAFQGLVEIYEQQVFRAAFLVLHDADEARDVAQETFMRGYKAMSRFKDEQPFRPWILKIAVNQALTTLRQIQRRRERRVKTSVAEVDYTIDEALIDRERAASLIAALNQMKENERIVIYLKYFMDLSEKELSHYLGCAQGTVKSRLHRALAKLRKVVVDDYPQLLEELS